MSFYTEVDTMDTLNKQASERAKYATVKIVRVPNLLASVESQDREFAMETHSIFQMNRHIGRVEFFTHEVDGEPVDPHVFVRSGHDTVFSGHTDHTYTF